METKYIAYPNNDKVKYVKRMKAHIKADELIKGIGFDAGMGCAVGCTLDKYDYDRFTVELGWPSPLIGIYDHYFESLPAPRHIQFPLDCLNACKPGANLVPVYAHWAAWMLTDPTWGMIALCEDAAVKRIIQTMSDLFKRSANGDEPTTDEWAQAQEKARAARAAWAAWAA